MDSILYIAADSFINSTVLRIVPAHVRLYFSLYLFPPLLSPLALVHPVDVVLQVFDGLRVARLHADVGLVEDDSVKGACHFILLIKVGVEVEVLVAFQNQWPARFGLLVKFVGSGFLLIDEWKLAIYYH